MALEFEFSATVAQGTQGTLFQDEEGKLSLFYIPLGSNHIHRALGTVELGLWDQVDFDAPEKIAAELNVNNLSVVGQQKSRRWLVWPSSEGRNLRMGIWEDSGRIYDNTSAYRLYYAIDTERLYMNISDHWEFIGSPRIDQLYGYADLLERIETGLPPEISERIDSIQMGHSALIEAVDDLASRIETLEESFPHPGAGEGGGTSVQFAEPALVDYVYYSGTGQSDYSVSVEAREGNRLIAAVVTRGELLQHSPDWELLGTGASLYDYTDKFTQYVYILHKEASGNDILEYSQALVNRSYACVMEFEHCGIPTLHHLESPIASTYTGLRATKRTLDTVLWVGHSIYWLSGNSATDPWSSSPQLPTLPAPGTEQPRLGVFIDASDMQEYELNAAAAGEEFSIIGVRLPKGIVRG